MKRLCDTRWTCRADSVKAVCNGYQAIIETLERVVEGDNRERAVESKGLLSQIKCLQFIACSVMFKKLLLRTQGLSDVLQSKELDLAAAMDLVETAIESLTKWRKQRKSWIKVWKEVEEMCRINEVPLELPSAGRRTSQHSRQMDDYIVMETAGQRRNTLVTSDGVETHYRVSVYYPSYPGYYHSRNEPAIL